jgi:2'-5' RNA ligase
MPYSIGLYFDQETNRLINQIWKILAVEKIAPYLYQSGNQPHITVGIYQETEITTAKDTLENISTTIKTFPISFQQIGIFPSPAMAVFWGPVVTTGLLQIHDQINKAFEKFSSFPEFGFYLPGHWIPHCALAMELGDNSLTNKIIEICRSLPNPHEALITDIGLISFRPVKQLCSCKFRA